jgi:alkylation response protein AidB-like acyl-CoA dehydrogenase
VQSATEQSFSSEDRELLRDSVRGQLARAWPPEKADERSQQPEQVRAIWQELCEQGLGLIGADPAAGGWREALIVIEELGRAACPAPMLETVLVNQMLAPPPRSG